ncbi:DUF4352 domain-containing protein [Salinimicrobium gaetbulicola]|uniref:DUF4352 domain-containing protein n=1 Tax=Salinimicrobium gaetbulicola TaxID=999702 RepID=A0ABW3IBZ3_9FLAO
MKKLLLLLLIAVSFTSCYTTYEVIPQKHNYSNSINYTIDKVEEGKSVAYGNGSYNASRGNKFVFVYLTFKNELEQKQDLDFDEFILLNPKTKTKHKAEWSMVVGPINLWGNIDSYIRSGDTKKRKLVFIYPEDDKAEYLLVKDEIVEIKYR